MQDNRVVGRLRLITVIDAANHDEKQRQKRKQANHDTNCSEGNHLNKRVTSQLKASQNGENKQNKRLVQESKKQVCQFTCKQVFSIEGVGLKQS